ncbi:hypothetical protein B0H12DRAFT_1039458, partial [Mycena haematopus]
MFWNCGNKSPTARNRVSDVPTVEHFLYVQEDYVPEESATSKEELEPGIPLLDSFAGKKYKPVALKTRPVYGELPEKYRIKREIIGDPL